MTPIDMPPDAPYRELDSVVLVRDVPAAGLLAGDVGTVVWVYGRDALEVEFVTNSGRTQAVRTLAVADVRPMADDDLPAVRRVGSVSGAASRGVAADAAARRSDPSRPLRS